MLKTITILQILFIGLLSSFAALADFDLPGNGTLVYETGTEVPFKFGFGFKQGPNGSTLKIGNQEIATDNVPRKYALWLTIHKEKHVFVQEFSKRYFDGFDWNLGDHHINLRKLDVKNEDVKGNYILTIDGEIFQFNKQNAEISIYLDKTGITSIETVGFLRYLKE